MKTVRALGLAAMTLLVFSLPAQAAVTGNCVTPPKMKFISSNQVEVSTTSMTFVNLADATVAFTQTTLGCVIVTFALGATANSLSDDLRVRAYLNNNMAGLPVEASLLSYNGATMQFVFRNVAAGANTLRIQFRSNSGSQVFVSRTVTTVLYQ